MTQQYLRQFSLVVADNAGTGIELAPLRVKFNIRQADIQTPATLYARVYNLDANNANIIQREFTQIVLRAGYQDASDYGQIFTGTIKQTKRGRESQTDNFLEFYCANNDLAYNFALMNTSFAAGMTPDQQLDAVQASFAKYGVTAGFQVSLGGTGLPRGKTFYGKSSDILRDLCQSANCSYSIVDNKLQILPNKPTGAIPGAAIVLNSKTGLIGTPEQTESGVRARCLLNPNMKAGKLVQIDNTAINQTTMLAGNSSPNGYYQQYDSYTNFSYLASVAADGFYRVLVADFSGDTRGEEWYTDITCLALGDTTPPALVQRGLA